MALNNLCRCIRHEYLWVIVRTIIECTKALSYFCNISASRDLLQAYIARHSAQADNACTHSGCLNTNTAWQTILHGVTVMHHTAYTKTACIMITSPHCLGDASKSTRSLRLSWQFTEWILTSNYRILLLTLTSRHHESSNTTTTPKQARLSSSCIFLFCSSLIFLHQVYLYHQLELVLESGCGYIESS